jgi:hypothetical protein
VPGLHFYTLNKARSTTHVLRNLGLAEEIKKEEGRIKKYESNQ